MQSHHSDLEFRVELTIIGEQTARELCPPSIYAIQCSYAQAIYLRDKINGLLTTSDDGTSMIETWLEEQQESHQTDSSKTS